VCLADVAVEGFEIEGQFAEILRLKSAHLQFDGDQAIEPAMEEQQIQREIAATDLQRILRTDEAEIAAQLDQKVFQLV
jgi:hypothetical protein